MSYHSDEAAAPVPARLGRYELLGQLAIGGMAEIHLARLAGEAGFEKIVVVKRLLPELVASKAFVAMFLDEGRLVAKIDHPNVCEVFELGREGAEYFIVMPYLDGVPATDFIARPRDPDRTAQLRVAAGIVVQACAGLHHAHELAGPDGPLGLVHRDVSPSNVFVTTAGVVKVLDFGVAKVRGAAETEAGTIKGKTQYMAPEQVLGEPLDRRCDVFALGIVLYELCTHQRLFKRASDYLAARAILEEPIPRADAVDPAVPAPLADAISRALARDRDARFADARELARAIEAAGGVAGADEIARALASWHDDELSAQRTRRARVLGTELATIPTGPPQQRARWPIAAVLAGVVAVAGAGIAWLAWPTKDVIVAPPADAAAIARSVVVAPPDAAPMPPPPPDAAVAHPVAVVHDHGRKPVGTGWLAIDSTPFATIFVDGKQLGITPLPHAALPAGRHTIRAVLHDGRVQDLRVDIAAGQTHAPIVLDRW
ncbi:MAG TPA: serine/threonine-protein kinase [Kofleriaceae bacterium]|nr:serine/threonine-protein kinase [Kofleriaceae bacterium]